HPVLAHVFPQPTKHSGARPVDAFAALIELRSRGNYFTVDIELQLIARAIADAHRTRLTVTVPVIQFTLLLCAQSVDAVHDGKTRLSQMGGMQQPLDEGLRLVLIT